MNEKTYEAKALEALALQVGRVADAIELLARATAGEFDEGGEPGHLGQSLSDVR